MAFFDGLSKTLSEKGKEAAHKAKVLTETVQLKGQISTEESAIQTEYQEIGRLVYERALEADAEAYAEAFAKIKASREKIAQLEDEIDRAEGVRLCAQCGAKVARDAAFCNSCGAKLEPIVEIPEEVVDAEAVEQSAPAAGGFCPSCGNPIEADAAFCMNCGAKLNQE